MLLEEKCLFKNMFKDLLKTGKCFKLILGAGNTDTTTVLKIIKFYYKAGCRFFDVAPDITLLKKAKEVAPDAYFCVSFGTNGEKHTLKAQINLEKCIKCGRCEKICLQNAIHNKTACIGCARCVDVCQAGAITLKNTQFNFEKILKKIVKESISCIELHAQDADFKEIKEKWDLINKNFKGIVSLCVGEEDFKNTKELLKNATPYSVIIQTDGKAMSGTDDSQETALPAVLCAKKYSVLPFYIFPSGGTNSRTASLLKEYGVKVSGIAFGTYARKISSIKEARALIDCQNNFF